MENKPNKDIGSYTICEEMLLAAHIEDTEKYLLNGFHENIVELLNVQIEFLKEELKQKNEIIHC